MYAISIYVCTHTIPLVTMSLHCHWHHNGHTGWMDDYTIELDQENSYGTYKHHSVCGCTIALQSISH